MVAQRGICQSFFTCTSRLFLSFFPFLNICLTSFQFYSSGRLSFPTALCFVHSSVHSSGSNYNGNTYRTSGGHYGGGGGSNNGNFGGGSTPGGSQVGRDDPCATTKWRPWGTCSKTCGQGIHRRRREFVNPGLAETYNCNKNVLVENEQCFGSSRNCNEPEQVAQNVYKNNAMLMFNFIQCANR